MSDPVVKIADKEYPVPPLVPRQQRTVIPALLRVCTAFKMLAPLPGQTEPRAVFDPEKMTTAMYDDMLNIAFWGVIWPNDKKANPGILMEAALPFDDLMIAINVVRQQTGMFRPAPEGATPGESGAASAS